MSNLLAFWRWTNKSKHHDLMDKPIKSLIISPERNSWVSLMLSSFKNAAFYRKFSAKAHRFSGDTLNKTIVGDQVIGEFGNTFPLSVVSAGHSESTYCLNVADNHNFVVGQSKHIVVSNCDDPHNISDAESNAIRNATVRWFDETLQTRVNDPDKSAIVVIMQRVHVKDVSGHILAKELGYEHLCLPMEFDSSRTCYTFVGKGGIRSDTPVRQDPRTEEKELMWPERFSRDYLKDLYKGMTQYAVSGQMQQLPVPREGGMLKYADFKIVKAAPAGGSEVRGWDLAASETSRADFTASVKMRRVDGKIYILYADRFRAGPDKVRRRMLNTASQDGKACKISFPQDPGQAGKAQAQSLSSNLMGYDVHSSTESGSKLIRIEPFAAQLEAGNVYLVEGEWNESYLQEMCNFPSNDFDDQVDATSRAFARLCQLRTDNVVIFPISLKNPIGVNPNG
jgi:predicted phage terminase large subunit-like protein